MCYYITGVFSGNVTITDINIAGKESNLQFEQCSNAFVQDQLKPEEIYIWKKCDYCDCETPLGMQSRKNNELAKNIKDSEIEKLRRKGWSETKIQRLLDAKNKNVEKNKQRDAATESEVSE